jgi:hypothetical protein
MPDSIPQDTPDHPAIDASMSKRYWLFWWHAYEAGGGMFDFVGSFDSAQDAVSFHQSDEHGHDRGMVFDFNTKKYAAILHVDKGWVYFD